MRVKRAMIFIDLCNVQSDFIKISNGNYLDVKEFIDYVQSMFHDLDFVRTHIFLPQTENNIGFVKYLRTIPYCQVTTGVLKERVTHLRGILTTDDGTKIDANGSSYISKCDKGTDVNLAVEMLSNAYKDTYDTALILSRDADFSSAIKAVQDIGKTVELVLFEECANSAEAISLCVDNVNMISRSQCKEFTKKAS